MSNNLDPTEFIENFLEHAKSRDKDYVKEYNRRYYLRTRKLKGRKARSGDDTRKPQKLVPVDPKVIKRVRVKLSSIQQRVKPLMDEWYYLLDAPDTPENKARGKVLDKKLEPYIKEVQALQEEMRKAGSSLDRFEEKYITGRPVKGRPNSSSPRSKSAAERKRKNKGRSNSSSPQSKSAIEKREEYAAFANEMAAKAKESRARAKAAKAKR